MSLDGTPEQSFEDELLNNQLAAVEQETGQNLVTASYFPEEEVVDPRQVAAAGNPELAAGNPELVQVQYVQDRGQRVAAAQQQGSFFQLRPGDEAYFKDEVIRDPRVFQGASMVEAQGTELPQRRDGQPLPQRREGQPLPQQRREGVYIDPQTGQELDPRTGLPIDRTQPRDVPPQGTQTAAASPLKQLNELSKASVKPGQPISPEVKAQLEQLIALTDRGPSPAITSLQGQYAQAKAKLDQAMPAQTRSQVQGLDRAILQEIAKLPPEQKEMATLVFTGYQRAPNREGMNQARDQLVKLVPGPTVANALANRDNLISPIEEKFFAANQLEGELRAEKNAPAVGRMVYAVILAVSGDLESGQKWLNDAIAKNRDPEIAAMLKVTDQQFKKSAQANQQQKR